MRVFERDLDIPVAVGHRNLMEHFHKEVGSRLPEGDIPIRLAVTSTDQTHYHCEIGVLSDTPQSHRGKAPSLFKLTRRQTESSESFNAVMLVPTGINCEIGGHAGDAGAAARLLAGACDRLITHPNVVNASDVNELPENGLYVEGSIVCRFLQGTVALQPVRSNRVLMVMDDHPVESLSDASINSLNAARAAFGLRCDKIVIPEAPIRLKTHYAASGRATGVVEGMESLLAILDREKGSYDAVALAGMIDSPMSCYMEYFMSDGEIPNPWGGVEAIYTHALSMLFNVPSAHAPMLRTEEIAGITAGVVDPRLAAEMISTTYLQCVLIGLLRSPKIIPNPEGKHLPGALTAADISCLVIPDGVLGLPVIAALEQGITVIAVRENRNLMRNDLSALPWSSGQYIPVDNYLEAVGVMTALRSGVSIESVRRPLKRVAVERYRAD
jgi:hypothetical protein